MVSMKILQREPGWFPSDGAGARSKKQLGLNKYSLVFGRTSSNVVNG